MLRQMKGETMESNEKGMLSTSFDRRKFLSGAAAAGALAAVGALTGCAPQGSNGSRKAEADEVASNKPGWRTAPDPITDITEVIDAEIVVIGAGNAGMCAGVTAAEAGAATVVLETHGNPQSSRSWIGAMNSKIQVAQGHVLDRNVICNDICRYSMYVGNQDLVYNFLDNSAEMMDWWTDLMQSLGLEVMLESAGDDYEYLSPPFAHHTVVAPFKPEGGNTLYQANVMLQPYMEQLGVDFRFKTRAEQLVQDADGNVTGVIAATSDGSHIQVNASKGVIVATGGFAGNEEMMEDLTTIGHRYCSFGMDITRPVGDGMKMMVWAGAQLSPIQETMIFDRGTVPDGAGLGFPMTQGGIWYGGTIPFLRVNTLGQRYSNEDQLYDWNMNAAISQPGHIWWQVFDGKYWEDAAKFENTRCARIVADPQGRAMNTAWIDGQSKLDEAFIAGQLDSVVESGAGKKADTLEGLAAEMGVPRDAFLSTISRYNELAAAGADTDYGKESHRLSTIEQGPFYAIRSAGWVLCTIGGVIVDGNINATREDGTAIKGLYAVGNDQAFYGATYPETYGGLNMGRNLTLARVAVKNALGIE